MIRHIRDAKTLKEAWDSLVHNNETHTKARKIQLKTELHTVKMQNMYVNDYTLKTKNIVESLASIGVTTDDDDKVEVCLHGLGPMYKQFKTPIQTRENIPNFQDLCSMLIVEEKNLLGDQDTST